MGLPSPWLRGVLYFCTSHCSRKHFYTYTQGGHFYRSFRWNFKTTEMSALFVLFHTRMWDRRACVLQTSGSFHTKLESRCPPQDTSISITFACLLCCYMVSDSFFLPLSSFHVRFSFPVLASPSLALTVASRLFLDSLIMFYFLLLSLLSSTIKFSTD